MQKNTKPAAPARDKDLDPPIVECPTLDTASVKRSLANHLVYSIGKDTLMATDRDWF